MYNGFQEHLQSQLDDIQAASLYKDERIITSPQSTAITVQSGQKVVNLCANNYLGLSNHPELIQAAKDSYSRWGLGLSSVRFICGTQSVHKQLEEKLSTFLETEDTILYSSCFDANGGLFESLLTNEDAIISDALNHASIIDGIRLCKAQRLRYNNSDMADLESKLKEAQSARFRLIATDGVFSMDGYIAKLDEICDLADKHNALVMVDDSHAVGFVGKHGKGTHEYRNVISRVDILTGTFGKALGGASGGYVSGRQEIIDILRQRSRPYLFSNSLAPAIASATLKALDLVADGALIEKLNENTQFFREKIKTVGLNVLDGEHPIAPVMIGQASLANKMAELMLQKGVYVTGFSYPVVPKGQARIRTQISAAHSKDELELAVEKFRECKDELGI